MTTRGMRFLFGLSAVALAAAVGAQPPAPTPKAGPLQPADLDRLAVEVLKDVHNRGAELYNRGDAGGCLRMYEGALLTVRPFLGHRPAVQKAIDDGLAEVARTEGAKVQAFRLHEVIEQVRTDLKADPGKKAETPPKPVEPPMPPMPPMPMNPPAGAGTGVTGRVTLDGKPLPDAEVTLVSLDRPAPRVFAAKVGKDGVYTFEKALPAGAYAVMVTGKVPEKYQTVLTSGLRFTVAAGANAFDLNLASK